ncbi:PfkB family carbohydrate kinase [Streptomyces sp. H10-C2]|uniref:carbohydrate kinase family protein n=1 Tax=unclassified Streptomyces TaxID=2593676 RepID=UPI0024B9018D|nr:MULTISPECIES: PfkB family carbohydrate kinase [unclassified Streptomyces]MDJ0344305.1 PfkB family carbohydrate kinase [Streptomyces sp. PH10-H1]MDJ0373674.1 PfkB family carbohydrate kinase [Streptomyces sp. H10-C2]
MTALLVIGDVVTDIVALHHKPLAPDTDTAARIAVRPGGSGANTASWAARSGAEVRLLARVGADSADWHRDILRRSGVRPQLRVDPALPTAVVIALVDPAAERTLVTDSGAGLRLGPEDWDETLLDGAGQLHLSGYLFFTEPGRELAGLAMAAARARQIAVSVDPASTGFIQQLGVRRFLDSVTGTDLLLPNLAEARLLTGDPDPVRAAEQLSAAHGVAVVKLGSAGALVAEHGAVTARVPGVAATAVDSTGAGDAFAGGFLAARLTGADLAQAAAAGCRTGASAVAVVGGRPEYS